MLANLPSDLAEIARSGEYRRHTEGEPRPYLPDAESGARRRTIEWLQDSFVLTLATRGADGWPCADCATYGLEVDEGDRPVFQIFLPADGLAVANILANPRVGVTVYRAFSFDRRRETKAVQVYGLASPVDGSEAWNRALGLIGDRRGPEKAAPQPGTDRLVRIEALTNLNAEMGSRPPMALIDYAADFRGQ